MLSFKKYSNIILNEKEILINNGAKYGNIVFLAGGAGSGKGFASENFINSSDYKIRDVDEIKSAFLKLSKLKNKYPEIKNLSLKNPNDVYKLHKFIESKGIVDKTLSLLIKSNKNKEVLPNIIFDVTLKNIKKIKDITPKLFEAGYSKENIHLIWVLTNYSVAVKSNRERERIVPDDILLKTHTGAHETMWEIIGKNNIPPEINGGIYIILNNRENTIYYSDNKGKPIKSTSKNNFTVKDFKYLTFKKPGKKPLNDLKIKIQLYTWIINNVPLTPTGVFKS